MNSGCTPPVAMAKDAPMSVRVGAPVPSFATSCQRVCVPRWKPMPMQFTTAAKVSIGRIGTLVAQEAIQLHGGIGMTAELALAHHAKRLILIDHQLGDEDHHLARFIELGRAA